MEINYPVLLVNPGINISTKWAFENITPAKLETSLFDTFAKGEVDLNKMCDLIKNDFESLIFYEYPQIAEIKEDLYKHGAAFALMTGTGSTVYGVFSNLQRAYFAEDYFKQKEYFTFLNNPFMAGSIT